MQPDPQKRAIRAAFGHAAQSYDSVAHVQRRIADALLEKCHRGTGIILDAGSGTGYTSTKLRTGGNACLALDHALPMLQQADGTGICGDIEALPLRDACIDVYFSSLAWQWTDPTRSVTEAARVLRAGGQLAVATLGPDTLWELREAFRHADDMDHVRRFVAADRYAALLAAAGFEHIDIHRLPFLTYSMNFRSMLHDIKTLGAYVVDGQRPRGLFGLQGFRRAEAHAEALRQTAGLPLTYDAVFITASMTTQHT